MTSLTVEQLPNDQQESQYARFSMGNWGGGADIMSFDHNTGSKKSVTVTKPVFDGEMSLEYRRGEDVHTAATLSHNSYSLREKDQGYLAHSRVNRPPLNLHEPMGVVYGSDEYLDGWKVWGNLSEALAKPAQDAVGVEYKEGTHSLLFQGGDETFPWIKRLVVGESDFVLDLDQPPMQIASRWDNTTPTLITQTEQHGKVRHSIDPLSARIESLRHGEINDIGLPRTHVEALTQGLGIFVRGTQIRYIDHSPADTDRDLVETLAEFERNPQFFQTFEHVSSFTRAHFNMWEDLLVDFFKIRNWGKSQELSYRGLPGTGSGNGYIQEELLPIMESFLHGYRHVEASLTKDVHETMAGNTFDISPEQVTITPSRNYVWELANRGIDTRSDPRGTLEFSSQLQKYSYPIGDNLYSQRIIKEKNMDVIRLGWHKPDGTPIRTITIKP